MKIELLIIDPQNDFCWPGIDMSVLNKQDVITLETFIPSDILTPGALFVPGANDDMERLAKMIIRLKDKLDDIHVTLDSHHYVDIAHPIFWLDSTGKHPDIFTIISADDVKNGLFRTTNPQFQSRATDYVNSLQDNGRYPLCIWPFHCLIGTFGYAVYPALFDALKEWEKDFAMVDYVTKGSNLWTEHYSAVKADVPDAQDPDTQLNMRLIDTLQNADIILLSGEAKSHCLANTVIDIADNFGEENIKKMVLLEDATSNVPDPPGTTMFTDFGEKFVKDMMARGMQVSNTVDFLA
jgi:nicotinamidase-related amidase